MQHSISKYVQKIESAYRDLSYSLGWRFLYGPRKTLVNPNGILWVGLNPGGEIFEKPRRFVEEGNAYIVEAQSWDKDGRSLANQIRMFFDELRVLPICRDASGNGLLEATLVSNFCPFRSPTWDKLPKREEAVEFSKDLWRDILGRVKPSLILCMGKETYSYLDELASAADFLDVVKPEMKHPCGWGNLLFRFKQYRYRDNLKLCLIVYLPHLSRYKLMSNSKCRSRVVSFINRLKMIYERP